MVKTQLPVFVVIKTRLTQDLYQSCSQLTSPRLLMGLVVCFPSDLYYSGDVIVINIIVVVLFGLVRP